MRIGAKGRTQSVSCLYGFCTGRGCSIRTPDFMSFADVSPHSSLSRSRSRGKTVPLGTLAVGFVHQAKGYGLAPQMLALYPRSRFSSLCGVGFHSRSRSGHSSSSVRAPCPAGSARCYLRSFWRAFRADLRLIFLATSHGALVVFCPGGGSGAFLADLPVLPINDVGRTLARAYLLEWDQLTPLDIGAIRHRPARLLMRAPCSPWRSPRLHRIRSIRKRTLPDSYRGLARASHQ